MLDEPPDVDNVYPFQVSQEPDQDDAYFAALAMSLEEWEALEQREGGKSVPASRDAQKAAGREVLWVLNHAWDEAAIPPRPWIAKGYLMRGAATVVSGPGSAGKSSLMVAWAAALALGMPYGHMEPGEPRLVATYNVEDDEDEQRRRFSGIARQLDVPIDTIMERLAILGPRGVGTLLHMTRDGRLLVNTPVMDRLEAWVAEHRPDVLMLDPFVELHAEDENDNTAIRAVMARFRTMAISYNMAVAILHHDKKGANAAGDPDRLRGASSSVGAARVVLTLGVMADAEADELGLPRADRRDYFRLDGAKSNYAPVEAAEWFRREIQVLDNGDAVAVAWPWQTPSSALRQADPAAITRALDRIAAGYTQGVLYAPTQRGGAVGRWVGNPIMVELEINETQAKTIVGQWLKSGLLVQTTYHDPDQRKAKPGVLVDDTKRPTT